MADPSHHQRLFEIFDAVADLPEDQQRATIDKLAGTDRALVAEVLDLLDLDQSDKQPLTGTEGLLPLAAEVLTEVSIPTRLGPYKVLSKLGSGGMGVVFEAEQEIPRRRVALKVVHPWLRSTRSEELLRHEVQAMAEVLHPGIPQVYQVFTEQGTTVVVMELVDGQSLNTAWASATPKGQLQLLIRIGEAIEAAHAAHVVHRDLKPANIKVLPNRQPKVLDFGIASRRDHMGAAGMGTEAYAAPEQLERADIDGRADVFALGVVMAELHLGRRPDRAPDGQVVFPAGVIDNVVTDAIVRKATQVSPEHRYASMSAMVADLRAALERRPVRALGWAPGRWVRDWLARNRWALLGATAAALLVVGLVAAGLGIRIAALGYWRESTAHDLLEQLQREPLDTAEQRAAAMRAFAEDPLLADTIAVSDAWMWVADRSETTAERRTALARAWSSARLPRQTEVAALALAQQLAIDGDWQAVRALSADFQQNQGRDLKLRLAIEAGDPDATRAHMLPTQRPALRWLAATREEFRFEQHQTGTWVAGQRYLVGEDAPVYAVDARGLQTLRQDLSPAGASSPWRSKNELRRVMAGMPHGPINDPEPMTVSFADLDQDGVPERYEVGRLGRPPFEVAEPITAPAKPALTWLAADSNGGRSLLFADLDGDGDEEAVLKMMGWTFSGLVVLDGLPDDPHVLSFIRSTRASAAALRTRHGTTLAIVGSHPTVPHNSPGLEPLQTLHTAVLRDGRLELEDTGLAFHDKIQSLTAVDLDGDELDELVLDAQMGSWVVLPAEDGEWQRVPLPALRVLDVGDFDGDGRDELWAQRDSQSIVLGTEGVGSGPLPPVDHAPALDTRPAPPGLTRWQGARWRRAELLASLGLIEEATAIFEDLAGSGGVVRTPALMRALTWLSSVRADRHARAGALSFDRSRIARMLDAEGGPDEGGLRGPLEAVLREEHDLAGVTPTTMLVQGASLHPSSEVDPIAVRVRPTQDDIHLRISGSDDTPVWSAPLIDPGRVVALNGRVVLADQDFGHGLMIGFELGQDARAGLQLQRVGGGPASNHALSIRCLGSGPAFVRRVNLSQRWREGVYDVQVSIDRDLGTVRCAIGGQAASAPIRLKTRSPTAVTVARPDRAPGYGQTELDLERLEIRGARVPERPMSPAYQAVLGDPDATQQLLASSTPEARWGGATLIGDPSAVDTTEIPHARRLLLLRSYPEVWAPRFREQLGDAAFAALLVEAFEHPLERYGGAMRRMLKRLSLADLPLESEAMWTVHYARALALLDEGRLLEGESLLARLAESPHAHGEEVGHLWLRTAKKRLAAGDETGAGQAIQQAMERSPFPLILLQRIWSEPGLAEFAPIAPGPSVTGGGPHDPS